MIRPAQTSAVRNWLELLRVPNLLTVPGDPIAGHLLAAGSVAGLLSYGLFAAGASLLFYMGGLILNDVADVDIDRAERPNRPLPSSRITVDGASIVAVFLLLAGEVVCVFLGSVSAWIGLGIVSAILLYDFRTKNIPVIGPLNMGVCRGLSLLLGAGAVARGEFLTAPVLTAFALLTVYIATVTHLARKETSAGPVGADRWLPVAVLLVGAAALIRVTPAGMTEEQIRAGGCMLLGCGVSFFAARRLGEKIVQRDNAVASNRPQAIGLLISIVILVQAAMIFSSGIVPWSLLVGLMLLAFWPLNRWTAGKFYAS